MGEKEGQKKMVGMGEKGEEERKEGKQEGKKEKLGNMLGIHCRTLREIRKFLK